MTGEAAGAGPWGEPAKTIFKLVDPILIPNDCMVPLMIFLPILFNNNKTWGMIQGKYVAA
jgi:hypothetical protein